MAGGLDIERCLHYLVSVDGRDEGRVTAVIKATESCPADFIRTHIAFDSPADLSERMVGEGI